MTELTMERLRRRIEEGSNPVEVAGYGRESTHKGYLSWLLNTRRWPRAKEGLIRLVEAAKWPDDRSTEWIRRLPDEFWCEYEKPVGGGKVDLIIRWKDKDDKERDLLPIELKTDTVIRRDQLTKMSPGGEHEIGLVLLLGSSAIRDDSIPKEPEKMGHFASLKIEDILTAWDGLFVPRVGLDWLESLQHERYRLDHAFDLTREQREEKRGVYRCYGYRSHRDLLYALLNSVRRVLKKYDLGDWSLYNVFHNTVLNLEYGNWTPVADGNLEAYWEFNDESLVLKVWTEGQGKIAREWIDRKRERIRKSETSWPIEYKFPKKAKLDSDSMSVIKWDLSFGTADGVACQSAEIIEKFQTNIGL